MAVRVEWRIVAIGALMSVALPAAGAEWTWATSIVSTSGDKSTSIALDAAGRPRVSYRYDGATYGVGYAAWNGSSWDRQLLDTGASAEYTSLALDSDGRARIAYYDNRDAHLKYASWDGASWAIGLVDGSAKVGEYVSLALDTAGRPRMSYYDRTHGDLKFAAWNGVSWDVQTVDVGGDVGLFSSLALSASGAAHISYYDRTNGQLKYAAWSNSAWALDAVDDVGNASVEDMGTSLALDASGAPRISYHAQDTNRLMYAALAGTDWDIANVDICGQSNALALDAQGPPRGSRLAAIPSYGSLGEMDRSGNPSLVDGSYSVGLYNSLAIDADGRAWISYYDTYYDRIGLACGVPEPATLSLLALGGLAMMRRRRK